MADKEKPANWREYIRSSIEVLGHVGWIWRDFMSPMTRRLFYLALAAVLLDSLMQVVWPYMFGLVIDAIQRNDVVRVCLAIGVYLVFDQFSKLWGMIVSRLGEKLGSGQVVDVNSRMTRMFFGKSLGQHLGDSQELSPANVERSRDAVRALQKIMLYQLIPTFSKTAILFVLILSTHWIPAIVAAVFVVYTAAWSLFLNRRVMTEGKDFDERLRAARRYQDERWHNVERVKAFGKEDEEQLRHDAMFREANEKADVFWLRYHFWSYLRAATSASPAFIGAMAFGAWMAISGEWTMGMVMPFIFWSSQFVNTVDQLRVIERQVNDQLPAIATLKRIMELEPAVRDLPDAVDFRADGPIGVEVRHVSFAHPGKDAGPTKPVLRDVSFGAEPGQKVAVIGPSGAGKTTLLHMLLRSRDPDTGSVHFDGWDIRSVRQVSFKRYIGYAPQGAPLFDGTIRELMLYGLWPEDRESANDDDIWKMLRMVKADFGERLDKGLDTKIGRDGIELSGGERQRLSAAMALMNPRLRLLIMDEPTSNLDSETQQGFQDGLKAVLERGVTTFIVAHRLSTVRDCDRFVVLKPVSELKDGESQIEAIASSFDDLYGISPTFRRVASREGLKFGPQISTDPKSLPPDYRPIFGDGIIRLNA